jgi:adenylate cyclase
VWQGNAVLTALKQVTMMAEQPANIDREGLGVRLRKHLVNLGWARLLVSLAFLALALIFARASWELPFTVTAERALYDWRTAVFTQRVDQDPRIVMVVYEDETLINSKKRSPLDRGLLARALTQINTMQPKTVGIDILFDQEQDEDAQLVAALRSMRVPTHVAYANVATNSDSITMRQQEALDNFMKALQGSGVTPASVRLEADEDNVQRSWAADQTGLPDRLTLALASDALEPTKTQAFSNYHGSIAWRLPKSLERPVFAALPIDLFANPETAPAFAEQIKGKHVLIGGKIKDIDQFETPLSGKIEGFTTMIGLEVHATMLAQILDGQRLRQLSGPWLWMTAIFVVLGGAITAFSSLSQRATAFFGALQIFVILAAPFLLQRAGFDTQFLPAFGWALGWLGSFSVTGTAARAIGDQQRQFAQSALGQYLPKDIATEILRQPERLALHGEKRAIFVLFSDLQGFTELSHKIEPEMVATLLNRYLEMLCGVVIDYGGTVDKFVGDAVVAFWGAPISRPDDGERAARAAYAMWQAGEEFRKTIPPGVPPVGKTRVGLHWGEAIVGNFGGEGRIQYTAIGDSMNTASRLESANKTLESNVLVSREAAERSGLNWWRPLGRVRLRGRRAPVDVFEPVPDIAAQDVDQIQTILNSIEANLKDAKIQLAELVSKRPGDMPLANLLNRISRLEPGGVYALD